MNMKTTKFLAVLAVLAFAFVAFATIAPAESDDAAEATVTSTDYTIDGASTATSVGVVTGSDTNTVSVTSGTKYLVNITSGTLTFTDTSNLSYTVYIKPGLSVVIPATTGTVTVYTIKDLDTTNKTFTTVDKLVITVTTNSAKLTAGAENGDLTIASVDSTSTVTITAASEIKYGSTVTLGKDKVANVVIAGTLTLNGTLKNNSADTTAAVGWASNLTINGDEAKITGTGKISGTAVSLLSVSKGTLENVTVSQEGWSVDSDSALLFVKEPTGNVTISGITILMKVVDPTKKEGTHGLAVCDVANSKTVTLKDIRFGAVGDATIKVEYLINIQQHQGKTFAGSVDLTDMIVDSNVSAEEGYGLVQVNAIATLGSEVKFDETVSLLRIAGACVVKDNLSVNDVIFYKSNSSLTVSAGKTLTIRSGGVLEINSTGILDNTAGTINGAGVIAVYGTLSAKVVEVSEETVTGTFATVEVYSGGQWTGEIEKSGSTNGEVGLTYDAAKVEGLILSTKTTYTAGTTPVVKSVIDIYKDVTLAKATWLAGSAIQDVNLYDATMTISAPATVGAGDTVTLDETSSLASGTNVITNNGTINLASLSQVVNITNGTTGVLNVAGETETVGTLDGTPTEEQIKAAGKDIVVLTGSVTAVTVPENVKVVIASPSALETLTIKSGSEAALSFTEDRSKTTVIKNDEGATTPGSLTVSKNFRGTLDVSYGSIYINGEEISGSFTEVSGTVKIEGSLEAGKNLTIQASADATIIVESGKTLVIPEGSKLSLVGSETVKLRMNNDGSIVGRGTIDVGKYTTFYTFTTVSVFLTGEGTIITEDSMEDVEISGYLTSSMKATPTQRVIVTGNLTIRAGEYLVITGELVVPEGVTVTVEEGGLLMLIDPTAHATISGTIKASGKSAVEKTEYNNLSAFTVDASVNKVPVTINGYVIAAKATADNVISVDLRGLTEIYGEVTVNTKAAANFAENAVVEATGKITVNGTFSGTISNEGLIEINGSAAAGTTIKMAAADATVNVIALKGSNALTITDLDMYLMTVDKVVKKVDAANANTIKLTNVSGVLIEEDIEYSLDILGNRTATNYMYMSGTTGFGDSKVATVPAIDITGGKTVVIAEELNLVKTVLTINADVLVSGLITVNNDESFVLYGQTEAKYANIFVTGGETIVTGMIQVTGNALGDTTETNIVAVKYTNRVALKEVYYYTTLKTAIDSGEKDFEVLKRLVVLEDTTVPTGVTVDASGKSVYIGNALLAPEASLIISDGANLTAKDITVIGTLYIENVDTGINCNNIISDTSSLGENDALYTNLYNALDKAEMGDVVKITSKENVVYLYKDSVIKTGVTLIIPGSKTLKICEGVTLAVNGFLQNKGSISAFYFDGKIEKVGIFAEKADEDTHAACITVEGMIESTTDMPYTTYKIPGAYYTSKTMYYITTVEAAALVATSVDGCKIDLYGTLEIGDVAFIGTESKNLEINVYGTGAAKGTFTVGNMMITYGLIKFKTAGTILNGTFGTATGSVKFANIETVGTENMIGDYIFMDDGEVVSVMAIQGSYQHSSLPVDTKKAPAITFDGDVAVKANLTINGLYQTGTADDTKMNGIVKIDDDSSFGVINGATLTINDANVTIDGEVLICDNGKMTVSKNDAYTFPTVTVNGSFIAADGSDEILEASGAVTINTNVIVNDLAVVGGNVNPGLLTVMPAGTVVGKLLETITAPSAEYTEFYVENALWKTVYLVNDVAGLDTLIQSQKAPGLEDCIQGTFTADNKTYYVWGKTDGSSTPVKGDIGTANKVYAYIIYDIYSVTIYTDAGVKSVSIDGIELWNEGTNKFVTAQSLKAGTHTVTFTMKAGYEGTPTLSTMTGTVLKDNKFAASGVTKDDRELTFQLMGTQPEPEPEPTPTPEEKSEWTITTILLCVLVVLIAIMAVIVALRLNRN